MRMSDVKTINKKEVDAWCFDQCVNQGHIVDGIKQPVSSEYTLNNGEPITGGVNRFFKCRETGETIELKYDHEIFADEVANANK